VSALILREAFDYPFSRLHPLGDHIDPPSVAVYETLVVKGPDWAGHPMLAAGWEVSGDGLEWRVRLRPGLRFHSGAPCDAAAVLAALEHLRDNAQPGRPLWYWDPVDSVTAAGDHELVFRLHHPYSRLPALLWGTHTAVYNEPRRAADDAGSGRTWADGTGPFRLVSWSPERVVAAAWEDYPGAAAGFLQPGAARLSQIEWISILDERERLAALERGEVDCLHGPPLDEVGRLVEDPRFDVLRYPQASSMYLTLDWRRRDLGFDDVRVRRAVSLAIDRAALVAGALHGAGTPAYGPVPPGDEFHHPPVDAGGLHDPAEAARLLESAGWALGADGSRRRGDVILACECVVQDDPVFARVAALVAEQLARVGFRLSLRPVPPFAPFYGAVAEGPAAAISKWLWQDPMDAIIGFSASYNDPFPNWQHSALPELDAAYADWLRAGSHDSLAAAAAHAQEIFAETLPYIPLLVPDDVWVSSRAVHGWAPFPANLYPFYQGVWLDDD
jgi:peptide/nickel transport system substrate-binding protein